MKLVVGHGEIDPEAIGYALQSIRKPLMLVTTHALWWEVAYTYSIQRLFFNEKLLLMRFVLGKDAICLLGRDTTEPTDSFGASMYAMSIPIWEVA